jgi:hypothetical protein
LDGDLPTLSSWQKAGAESTITRKNQKCGFSMEATLVDGSEVRFDTRRFHLWMAGIFVLIAFGGFTPSYWARVASGTFQAPPIVHIHGILLFTWTLFYFLQAAWVASGRTPTHRAWGTAGIALFSVLICSIIVTKITMMRLDDAHGFGDASRRFSAVAFCNLPVFIGVFALAIANVRRPETHKRLMYVLMSGMMIPAIARVFLAFLAPPGVADHGPPPAFVAIPPGLVAALLIVVAIVYDWRTRGRPHMVYVYGGLAVVLSNTLTVVIAGTQTWMTIAGYLESLGG